MAAAVLEVSASVSVAAVPVTVLPALLTAASGVVAASALAAAATAFGSGMADTGLVTATAARARSARYVMKRAMVICLARGRGRYRSSVKRRCAVERLEFRVSHENKFPVPHSAVTCERRGRPSHSTWQSPGAPSTWPSRQSPAAVAEDAGRDAETLDLKSLSRYTDMNGRCAN